MRTRSAALVWAANESRSSRLRWFQLCLKFVRSCYGIKPWYRTAAKAWEKAKFKHPGDRQPPLGVAVWWAGGKYGHVAISCGDGTVYSNDIRRRGQIDRVPLGIFETKWGFKYLGWTEDVNRVRIYTPPPAKPPTLAPKPPTLAPKPPPVKVVAVIDTPAGRWATCNNEAVLRNAVLKACESGVREWTVRRIK